jgi:two-component system, LytTR family, sensor histidine kinase AlgZ
MKYNCLNCGKQAFRVKMIKTNEFIFSPKHRILRHVSFWLLWLFGWTCFLSLIWSTFTDNFIRIGIWIPVFTIYGYPVSYIAIPKLLLKSKYLLFLCSLIFWLAVGWYLSVYFLTYISAPVLDLMGLPHGDDYAWQCFLCVVTTTACFSSLSLGKQWLLKQKEFLQAQQEKITAELQLLKAQVHPHFLFNTLNNIYAFSLEKSPKTPGLILKLSSLLSYMLYDCKTEEVRLEKEAEIMKNYIDLEKERYGNKIEISWNIEGAIKDKFIAPLMLLPFLENAFKHGTSEQIEKSWLSVDISVKQNTLLCKIANSKNEYVAYNNNGIGINNVKKRLELIYPEKHELKISDEGDFFVVSMLINLTAGAPVYNKVPDIPVITQTIPA